MILDIIQRYNGECITDNSGSYSYIDLANQVKYYNQLLESKIKKNDRIIIYSDYTFYSVSLLISLSQMNVNIIPIVKTTELEYNEKVSSVSPNLILSFNKKNDLNFKYINTENNSDKLFNQVTSIGDTGIILFSSGTTGTPKVMVQNFSSLISSISIPKRQKSLKFIILLMFDHIGGLNTLLNCLISGTTFVIPYDRNPSTVISLIYKYNVNILPTTPTFLNLMMMDESFNSLKLKSLKLITYGTERMSETLLNKLNDQLPKIKLLQTFGTSETGILKTQSKSSSSLFFKISDQNKEYKIIKNELFLRSKTQVKGYLNHENNSFKKDGWYATGDLVETDKDGFIKIIGRKNKIINVGGLKVLPKEVEDVINKIEEVDDSSVYGEENNLVGNIVCARIFTSYHDKKYLKSIIKAECRKSLDKYKIPVKLHFSKLKITNRGKKSD